MTCHRCDKNADMEEIYSFDTEQVSFWQCVECKDVVAKRN